MLYYKIYSDNKGKLSYNKPAIICIHSFASNIGIFAKQIFVLRKKYRNVFRKINSTKI